MTCRHRHRTHKHGQAGSTGVAALGVMGLRVGVDGRCREARSERLIPEELLGERWTEGRDRSAFHHPMKAAHAWAQLHAYLKDLAAADEARKKSRQRGAPPVQIRFILSQSQVSGSWRTREGHKSSSVATWLIWSTTQTKGTI